MANWITHMMIVDRLFDMGLALDRRGFAVGNVAPDCNVENEDWTEFMPSREITHWMTGEFKDSADCEGFFDAYVRGKSFAAAEEYAFLMGYYAHLIADSEFQRFYQSPELTAARFERIKSVPEYAARVAGLPEKHDTIRRMFTKREKLGDMTAVERDYVRKNPGTVYNTVLKNVKGFADYIDYLPAGAVARKIPIMLAADAAAEVKAEFVFLTPEEHGEYVRRTAELIFDKLKEKMA